MAKVIEGLYYSESHEYVKVEGDFAYVGITDYAQHALGNVVYVDMPEVDDEVEAGLRRCRERKGSQRPYLSRVWYCSRGERGSRGQA